MKLLLLNNTHTEVLKKLTLICFVKDDLLAYLCLIFFLLSCIYDVVVKSNQPKSLVLLFWDIIFIFLVYYYYFLLLFGEYYFLFYYFFGYYFLSIVVLGVLFSFILLF